MIKFRHRDLLDMAGYSSNWQYKGGYYNLKIKTDTARLWYDEVQRHVVVETKYSDVWIVEETYETED